jgi:hypothetical protein
MWLLIAGFMQTGIQTANRNSAAPKVSTGPKGSPSQQGAQDSPPTASARSSSAKAPTRSTTSDLPTTTKQPSSPLLGKTTAAVIPFE